MGEKTIEELEFICNKYDIRIRSLLSLRESMVQYQFPAKLYLLLFEIIYVLKILIIEIPMIFTIYVRKTCP